MTLGFKQAFLQTCSDDGASGAHGAICGTLGNIFSHTNKKGFYQQKYAFYIMKYNTMTKVVYFQKKNLKVGMICQLAGAF